MLHGDVACLVNQVANLLLEEREVFPLGENVAVDAKGGGDGVSGLPGDEQAGGAELVASERAQMAGRGWPGRSWVRFARRRVGRDGVGWGALAGGRCGKHHWGWWGKMLCELCFVGGS